MSARQPVSWFRLNLVSALATASRSKLWGRAGGIHVQLKMFRDGSDLGEVRVHPENFSYLRSRISFRSRFICRGHSLACWGGTVFHRKDFSLSAISDRALIQPVQEQYWTSAVIPFGLSAESLCS